MSAPTVLPEPTGASWTANRVFQSDEELPDMADAHEDEAVGSHDNEARGRPQARTLAIVAERITKVFDARRVLREVSFTLEQGRALALLGPNGAGKTTLLRILATLAKPTSGRVVVAGCDLAREATAARWAIGYVGHQTGLYDELTARENLLFFARMYGLRDGAKRAETLLTWVGLRTRANDLVRTFSRGQAQPANATNVTTGIGFFN
ncbi:MAG TPA: ABC transporter ATP-binding protein, partial [Ktedonobacterales bacterium]|nr:ABC transporter ATP-binding protein [Ktedonobacterales bacterium]